MKNTQIRQNALLGSVIALAFTLHHPFLATAKSLGDFTPSGSPPGLWMKPSGTPNQSPPPPEGVKQHNPPSRYIPDKPAKTILSPEAIPGEIIVKFDESAVVRLRNNQLVSVKNDLADVKKVLAKAKARIQRLSSDSEEADDERRNRIQGNGGLTAPDMNSYYLITLDTQDRESQATLIDALNALPDVAIAYAPGKVGPAYMGDSEPSDKAPFSDSYESKQRYLNAPPWGVNARSMWTQTDTLGNPIKGQGVRLNVVEYGWDSGHEDYKLTPANILRSNSDQSYTEHGTATIGVLFASHNDYGVSGLAPNVNLGLAQIFSNDLPEANQFLNPFITASNNAGYGDIVIFEQQAIGQIAQYLPIAFDCMGILTRSGPIEIYDAIYDRITQSALEGKIVIEPAGNHGVVLEKCYLDSNEQKKFNRQAANFVDSGAIIVGAGKYDFDGYLGIPIKKFNSGNRVDLQGWGENVSTTGTINSPDGISDPDYTDTYNGTSSATPIVAGAAALVQSYFKNVKGKTLNGYEMRQLLVNTGTPGGSGTEGLHVGPLPDVVKASQSNLISPTITANGVRGGHKTSATPHLTAPSDTPDLTVSSGTKVTINTLLDTSQFHGTRSDYWFAVDWNGTLWHWSGGSGAGTSAGWYLDQKPWFQNVLFDFPTYETWNPVLYTGNYTFYFCVDTIQNGVYKNNDGSTPGLYCDQVSVKVN